MSIHHFIACDGCNQEIESEFITRPELASTDDKSRVRTLIRRDLCDACATRVRQAIISSGLEVDWLLVGFERGKK